MATLLSEIARAHQAATGYVKFQGGERGGLVL